MAEPPTTPTNQRKASSAGGDAHKDQTQKAKEKYRLMRKEEKAHEAVMAKHGEALHVAQQAVKDAETHCESHSEDPQAREGLMRAHTRVRQLDSEREYKEEQFDRVRIRLTDEENRIVRGLLAIAATKQAEKEKDRQQQDLIARRKQSLSAQSVLNLGKLARSARRGSADNRSKEEGSPTAVSPTKSNLSMKSSDSIGAISPVSNTSQKSIRGLGKDVSPPASPRRTSTASDWNKLCRHCGNHPSSPPTAPSGP
eukprot:gene2493-518_t